MNYQAIIVFLLIDIALLMMIYSLWWFRTGKYTVLLHLGLLLIFPLFEFITDYICLNGDKASRFVLAWGKAPFVLHLVYPTALLFFCAIFIYKEVKRNLSSINRTTIFHGINEVDEGLMFGAENGATVLINRKMEELSEKMFSKYPVNADIFWEKISNYESTYDCRRLKEYKNPTFSFDNGEVWTFERRMIEDEMRKYSEILSRNVTDVYNKYIKLRRENEKLKQLETELSEKLKNVAERNNQEELLKYKVRVHDQLGSAVLNTRLFLRAHESENTSVEEILKIWENTSKGFRENTHKEATDSDADYLKEVLNQAEAFGVNLVIEGDFPSNSKLCIRILKETMYNSVRHGYAHEMKVVCYRNGSFLHIRIADDGVAKGPTITEGGGLSSIREYIENNGGMMRVTVKRGVELDFDLPDALVK